MMTSRQYELYKGLMTTSSELERFKPRERFSAQTDRWALNKVGKDFIEELEALIEKYKVKVEEEKKL